MVWAKLCGRVLISSCSLASVSVASYVTLGNSNTARRVFSSTLAAPAQTVQADDIARNGPTTLWDDNWDRRDPHMLVKNQGNSSEEVELQRPTAVRRLYLIRHGEYHTSGATDDDRTLTELGHRQADLTAERFLALGLEPTVIYFSTMTRARETFQAFAKAFPSVRSQSCDMLREGAPCPPEPPSKNWKPEVRVS